MSKWYESPEKIDTHIDTHINALTERLCDECAAWPYDSHHSYCEECGLLADAVTVAKALRQAKNRWTPVSERLPDDTEACVVVWKTDRSTQCFWAISHYDGDWSGVDGELVTHWSHLPGLPDRGSK